MSKIDEGKMYKIVEKKKIWFLISAAIIVVGIVFGCIRGLNFGIDFLGGSKVVLDCKEGFDKDKADEIVNKYVSDAVTNTVENQEDGKKQYEIKSTSLDSEKFADLFTELKNDANIADEIASQEEVGASFGADLAKNSLIALGIAFVPSFARIVRSEFMYQKNLDYVKSARLMGAGHLRIMCVHILPNLLPVLISSVMIGFNNAVLAEAGMSYLGIGVQPPDASLGRMLSEAQTYLFSTPTYALFPGLVLILMVLGFSLLADGVKTK